MSPVRYLAQVRTQTVTLEPGPKWKYQPAMPASRDDGGDTQEAAVESAFFLLIIFLGSGLLGDGGLLGHRILLGLLGNLVLPGLRDDG